MALLQRIPLWLKTFIVLIAISLFLSPIASILPPESLGLIFIVALITFPGPTEKRPRLIRAYPFVMAVDWVFGLAIFALSLVGIDPFPREMDMHLPSKPELLVSIIVTPILLNGFFKDRSWYPKMVVVSFGLSAIAYLGSRQFGGTSETYKVIDLIEVAASILVTFYTYKKWTPRQVSTDSLKPIED